MTTKLITGKCRVNYVHLYAPIMNQLSGKEEYSVQLIFPKADTELYQKLSAAIEFEAREKFGSLKTKALPKYRSPLRDGDEPTETGKDLPEEYKGHWYFNAKSNPDQVPGVLKQDKTPSVDPADLVSGDYCRASVRLYGYDKNGNRGVSIALDGVQIWARGKAIGNAKARIEDEFTALELDDTSDDIYK